MFLHNTAELEWREFGGQEILSAFLTLWLHTAFVLRKQLCVCVCGWDGGICQDIARLFQKLKIQSVKLCLKTSNLTNCQKWKYEKHKARWLPTMQWGTGPNSDPHPSATLTPWCCPGVLQWTYKLESSVSKMFCICMTSLWNKGQVILGPCIKWIPHHKCFWQRNKERNKPKEYQTTQQPGFKPSLSFHCASFYSKYFLLTDCQAGWLSGLAIWPILRGVIWKKGAGQLC